MMRTLTQEKVEFSAGGKAFSGINQQGFLGCGTKAEGCESS